MASICRPWAGALERLGISNVSVPFVHMAKNALQSALTDRSKEREKLFVEIRTFDADGVDLAVLLHFDIGHLLENIKGAWIATG